MVFYVHVLLLFTKQLAHVFENTFRKSIREAIEEMIRQDYSLWPDGLMMYSMG